MPIEIPGHPGDRPRRAGGEDTGRLAPVLGGLDVAVVRDGLIATLYTVLDGDADATTAR